MQIGITGKKISLRTRAYKLQLIPGSINFHLTWWVGHDGGSGGNFPSKSANKTLPPTQQPFSLAYSVL